MKPPTLKDRVDLDDVIDPVYLHDIVKSLAAISGLAAGIVRMPPEGQRIPTDPDQFNLWRLTPVEPKGPPFNFCETLREVPALNSMCMWSDLRFARKALEIKEPLIYRCVTSNLLDIVAPVLVGGQHVANIYIGRARPPGSTFDTHFQHILNKLKEENDESISEDVKERLDAVFSRLPERDDRALENVKPLLSTFAELLSQRADRQLALQVISEIANETEGMSDEITCAELFYRRCKKVLNYDTGSVFFIHGTGKKAVLESAVLDWRHDAPSSISFELEHNKGLIPKVARQAMIARSDSQVMPSVLCSSREMMENAASAGYDGSRNMRDINSFLGVPIECETQLLGVLEIGARRTNAFDEADRHLLQAIANYLGIMVMACRSRKYLTTILAKTGVGELLYTVANCLPELTQGTGCSIFLRDNGVPKSDAVLFASSELPKTLVGRASYELGEGLTGWVLEKGRILNLPGGENARSSVQLDKISQDLKWAHKYIEGDLGGIDYTNMPFLACPIRAANMEVIGVIRIGGREAGNFNSGDERTIKACADAIGAVVDRVGIDKTVREIRDELRTMESKILSGQKEILLAIRRSPHAFVILLSIAGFSASCLLLMLFYTSGLRIVDPSACWFGVFAFASYWLMGKTADKLRRREYRHSRSPFSEQSK